MKNEISTRVKKMAILMISCSFLTGFSACIPEEMAVAPHPLGDATLRSLSIGADYQKQVFYNIEKNEIISENLKSDWDLAFDCSDSSDYVLLNQAKFMSAWKSDAQNLNNLQDTIGFDKYKKTDASNRSNDSLAFGNLRKSGAEKVFVVFLGYDKNGDPIGYKKVKINASPNKKYVLHYSNLDNSDVQTVQVDINTNFNFVYFSFKTNRPVRVEPEKGSWDFSVTQYVHQFYEPYQAYLVTGILLNPHQTQAAVDSSGTKKFEDYGRNEVLKMPYESRTNMIGYNWKVLGANNRYFIAPNYLYFVKTSKGYFYKMRFVSFYDEQGAKGAPKFEFQRL
ncbi:MAG: hypothetical protein RL757_1205 [Bacteroidota bacterium]|jgi:hypothetical protein